MGIYIPDMEMPKSCEECLNIGWNYVFECRLDDMDDGERLPSCPLVPVPKHGRLIDGDALCKAIVTQGDMADLRVVDMTRHIAQMFALLVIDAPVVVPADKKEEIE